MSRSSRRNRRSVMSTASFSDDDDAITPCPSPPPATDAETHTRPSQHPLPLSASRPDAGRTHSSAPTSLPQGTHHAVPHLRRGSANSDQLEACRDSVWHFDPAEGKAMDDERLWRRMLAIQRTFHCYNSARMSAALTELEMGQDVGQFVPSRTCLDLLNDSISELPEEFRHQIDSWLHGNAAKRI